MGAGAFAHVGDVAAHRCRGGAAGEHHFGVASGELGAGRRAGGLEQHRGALPRGLAEVRPGDPEVLADVVDVAHLGRVGVDAPLAVGDHRVVVPGAFPELVEHVQVFVGDLVAAVVGHLVVQAEVARGVGQVGGDDVPADAAAGQVVEGAHAPGEGEGRLVGGGEGGAEAQVAGHRGHRRDDQQRVVAGHLHGFAQGRLGAAAEAVVDAHHVGQEDAVEGAVLQQLRQFRPVVDVVEAVPLVFRVGPEAVDDVADAVHLEQVNVQWLRHGCGAPGVAAGGEWRPAGRGCSRAAGGRRPRAPGRSRRCGRPSSPARGR